MEWLASLLPDVSGLHDFYASNLRSSIFTGFFTLSGFLLSMKTFILINIKREVYESESYEARFQKLRQVQPKLKKYGPLNRLSKCLFVTILCAVITSGMQLTVGLSKSDYAALACLAMAFLTLALVVVMLFVMRHVMAEWLKFLEEEAAKPRKAS
jgi:hypothetical protein